MAARDPRAPVAQSTERGNDHLPGRPPQVNMTDIARAAGVSMATTSRALNDLPGVSAATREKVLRVAQELDYVVSPAASTLKGGTTGRVAVVVPHLSRWFFGEMLTGIESVFRAARLDLMLYHVGESENRESFFQELPARRKVDAVLVVGIPVTEAEQQRLSLMGVEIFAAGGQSAPYPFVSIDDAQAGATAVNHLLHLGHRRIAMIDAIDPNADAWPVNGRALSYTEAMDATGAGVDPALFVRVPWGAEPGADAMAQLLGLADPPTAVFVHSDEMAFGALRTIRRAGLRVPEDVSVIGVDDHPLSAQLDLTTIHQDVLEQGRHAAQLVVDSLTDDGPRESVVLPTRLVLRGSTAPPLTRSSPTR
jgi:DNA-binding LacI/PurR family transcriptional regulator